MKLTAKVKQRFDVLGVAAEARALAKSAGLDARYAEELALVVAELGMNAVRHGLGHGTIDLELNARGWSVEVHDDGPGLSAAVLADGGRSDRLGHAGVRTREEVGPSFGSGLASVTRLSSVLSLTNKESGGARVVAQRIFDQSLS